MSRIERNRKICELSFFAILEKKKDSQESSVRQQLANIAKIVRISNLISNLTKF